MDKKKETEIVEARVDENGEYIPLGSRKDD